MAFTIKGHVGRPGIVLAFFGLAAMHRRDDRLAVVSPMKRDLDRKKARKARGKRSFRSWKLDSIEAGLLPHASNGLLT